jgi:hypothetical protein
MRSDAADMSDLFDALGEQEPAGFQRADRDGIAGSTGQIPVCGLRRTDGALRATLNHGDICIWGSRLGLPIMQSTYLGRQEGRFRFCLDTRVLRSGAPWRDLPTGFGHLLQRFVRW